MRSMRTMGLLLAPLLALTTEVGAQPFQRVLGGSMDDQPHCIERLASGEYIISGTQSEMILT